MSAQIPATPASPVRAVLFDYGLVLSGPPHPPAWERMRDLFNAPEAVFHHAYWRSRHAYDRGELTGEAYWRQVAADLDHRLDPERLQALLRWDTELWTQPNQAMIDWAAALQAAGVRTGILSNLGDAMEVGVLERCPWLGGFAHHTFSHRLRLAKPELAIYRHAAEGLGVPPAQVLFIDDREDNIEAARQAGMQAIRYTDHDAFLEELRAANFGLPASPATKVEGSPHPVAG